MKGSVSDWGLSTRFCDNCHIVSALLYCRTDVAFLCGTCDLKIHTPNCHVGVTISHERVWMCEVCEQAPAAITCKADAAVLCSSCDHDIHSANPLASRHERVPVVPFLDSAVEAAVRSSSAAAASTFLDPAITAAAISPPIQVLSPDEMADDDAEAWLLPNLNTTFMYGDSDLLDFSFGGQNSEKHSHQNHENQSFAITDSVVPTQSKANLSFSDTPDHILIFDNSFDIDFSQPEKQHIQKNKNNNNQQLQLFSFFNFSSQHTVLSSDIGVVPEVNANSLSEVSYAFGNSVSSSVTGDGGSIAVVSPAPALDRAARVLRYREKRKNRKFQKTIRYASRKAYAETRPRIKGRFVKRTGKNETSDVDQMLGLSCAGSDSGFDFELDQGYGVVPTF